MGEDVTEALAPDDGHDGHDGEHTAEPTPLRAVQAETAAEQRVKPDGSIEVMLRTDLGEAPITVPPINRWRSTARNAIFSRMDDLFWAAKTLSVQDLMVWNELDPTQDDAEDFFRRFGEATGQAIVAGGAGAPLGSRPSSPSTRRH